MVSRRPSAVNHLKDSSWIAMSSGTSRMGCILEKDLRGLGVVLRLKRAHSSRQVGFSERVKAQTQMLSRAPSSSKPSVHAFERARWART